MEDGAGQREPGLHAGRVAPDPQIERAVDVEPGRRIVDAVVADAIERSE